MSDDMSSAVGTSDEVDIVQRSLSTGLPAWCSYQGVTCGTVSGSATYESVTSISLLSLSLVGTIPSSIGSMTSLTSIDLSINSLSGTIPSSIGSLTSLQGLWFGINRLSGTIPSSIGSLILLQVLWLDVNRSCIWSLRCRASASVPASWPSDYGGRRWRVWSWWLA